MGFRQCLPLSVVQMKGKHCRQPHYRNGVEDTIGPSISGIYPIKPCKYERFQRSSQFCGQSEMQQSGSVCPLKSSK